MDAGAVLPVQNRRPGVAVGLQPRPGRLLELVEDSPDLCVGGPVLRRPRDHARGVLPLEAQGVGKGGHLVRVAAQNLDARSHPSGGIAFADEIVGRGASGAGAARGEANEHRHGLRRGGRRRATNARTRRGWRSPSRPSVAEVWVLAQRASWFRLLPMRATWTLRSRSISAAAVQVRVRAIAFRSSVDSGTPAAAALERQAARSAGDTRRWICTERRSAMGAPVRGFGGRRPPSARCSGSGAVGRGFGGRRSPSACCSGSGAVGRGLGVRGAMPPGRTLLPQRRMPGVRRGAQPPLASPIVYTMGRLALVP